MDLDGLEEFNALKVLGEVFIKGGPKMAQAGSKTLLHLASIATKAINIAANIVNDQIEKQTVNQGLSNVNVQNQLNNAIQDYYLGHADEMSNTDFIALDMLTKNYFKGLNLMAWWAKGDFVKLNRSVIKSTLPDPLKIQLVQLGIEDIQEGFAGIMGQGANVGLFIAGAALFPVVGPVPRTPFSSSTQQTLVESQAGVKFTNTTIKRYLNSSRTVSKSDLKNAIQTKAYSDRQGSGASAYYSRIIRNGKSYNLKVIYNKKTNTIFHFHYSRQAMGPLSKISK